MTIAPPSDRFRHLNMDLIGPLPPSRGKTYCLTIIDRFTKWMEAIPIPSATAENVIRALYNNWITRFGVPEKIITDRGSQFTSYEFKQFLQSLGIKLNQTTAYHPQANGMIERSHRTLKAALKAKEDHRWTETLPSILLGLRNTIKQGSPFTPAELTFGTSLRLPGEFFDPPKGTADPAQTVKQLRKTFENIRSVPATNNSRATPFVHPDLRKAEFVFVRHDAVRTPLQQPYDGPYEVVSRNEKYFTIRINGTEKTVSIDRLKPAFLLNEEFTNLTELLPEQPTSTVVYHPTPAVTREGDDPSTPPQQAEEERAPHPHPILREESQRERDPVPRTRSPRKEVRFEERPRSRQQRLLQPQTTRYGRTTRVPDRFREECNEIRKLVNEYISNISNIKSPAI